MRLSPGRASCDQLPPMVGGAGRVVLIVMDGVGIGRLDGGGPDPGANTLRSVLAGAGFDLELPSLSGLGLRDLLHPPDSRWPAGPPLQPAGTRARLVPISQGKDSLTGHWELAGLITDVEMRTFPAGFPPELLSALEAALGCSLLGGQPASGTEIIARLGPEHLQTRKPIVYTSADSVLQIAAHDEVLALEELYRLCEAAREVAKGPWLVGRVIARPFTGEPGGFHRTAGRRDYSVPPPAPTLLDEAQAAGVEVIGVGKIAEVFSGQGISRSLKPSGNSGVMAALAELLAAPAGCGQRELIFANLNDFDTVYGHRRDAGGFAAALKEFDEWLGVAWRGLRPSELLVVTADHGCDPVYQGTDHTQEDVPLLIGGAGWRPANLGVIEGLTAVAGLVSAVLDLDGFAHWPRGGRQG